MPMAEKCPLIPDQSTQEESKIDFSRLCAVVPSPTSEGKSTLIRESRLPTLEVVIHCASLAPFWGDPPAGTVRPPEAFGDDMFGGINKELKPEEVGKLEELNKLQGLRVVQEDSDDDGSSHFRDQGVKLGNTSRLSLNSLFDLEFDSFPKVKSRIVELESKMSLAKPLEGSKVVPVSVFGNLELAITGIQQASRPAFAGDLSVCGVRRKTEWHLYLTQADKRSTHFKLYKTRDVFTLAAMVARYIQNDMLDKARRIFDKLPWQDYNSWTAIVAGYVQSSLVERALYIVLGRKRKDNKINVSTLTCTFSAGVNLAAPEWRKQLQGRLVKARYESGYYVGNSFYKIKLRALVKGENALESVKKIVKKIVRDREEVCSWNPLVVSSILVNGGCHDHAAKMLISAISNDYELDHNNLLSPLSSYSLFDWYLEAHEVLECLRKHASSSRQLLSEALVVIACKAQQLGATLVEFGNTKVFGSFHGSYIVYETWIHGCTENELISEALQVFFDMRFLSGEPSEYNYHTRVLIYCKIGFTETAHQLVGKTEKKGILLGSLSICVNVMEAYRKLKQWQKAESSMGNLRQMHATTYSKGWNALIQAYAINGGYEWAGAIFNIMVRDIPSLIVDSINGLLRAFFIDEKVIIQELQNRVFKMSKSFILSMIKAFTQPGEIFEVKKVYHGREAVSYFPFMHPYMITIGWLCKEKQARDVEAMSSEMEEAGFKLDPLIWNFALMLYAEIEDFKKTTPVYPQFQEVAINLDENTYNAWIIMYCRNCRVEEGLSLIHEMRRDLEPKLDTYKSMIATIGKQRMLEQAKELFEEFRSIEHKLDHSFYHLMMKLFQESGNHPKATNLLGMMKEGGVDTALGAAGCEVGGIETEAALLGRLPSVVGFKMLGKLCDGVIASDLVLTVTQILRKHGFISKLVEFYGEGMEELLSVDRTTVVNAFLEYGATMSIFHVDHVTWQYLKLAGRSVKTVSMIHAYLHANTMSVDYNEPPQEKGCTPYRQLDLVDVETCVPKIFRPKWSHDRVPLKERKAAWHNCLDPQVGFPGLALPNEEQDKVGNFSFHGQLAELKHSRVVISAILSCTTTSNPNVMPGAGIVAKKVCELELHVNPLIKTSLAPGSGVLQKQLCPSGVQKYLIEQSFQIVIYGCTTGIGNFGGLDPYVTSAISENDIKEIAVLFGNRNLEGRVHSLTRANYLGSPPLGVFYALVGTVGINFDKEPLGTRDDGENVYFEVSCLVNLIEEFDP